MRKALEHCSDFLLDATMTGDSLHMEYFHFEPPSATAAGKLQPRSLSVISGFLVESGGSKFERQKPLPR